MSKVVGLHQEFSGGMSADQVATMDEVMDKLPANEIEEMYVLVRLKDGSVYMDGTHNNAFFSYMLGQAAFNLHAGEAE